MSAIQGIPDGVDGFEVFAYWSENDGRLVIEIDTRPGGRVAHGGDSCPLIRVHVNDGLVYGEPLAGEGEN